MAKKTFQSIAGGNATGITVLDSDKQLTTLASYGAGAPWRPSAPAEGDAKLLGICGNAVDGVAVLQDDKQVKYLTVVDSPLADWKVVDGAPGVSAPVGIAGSPGGTLVVYGGTEAAAQKLGSGSWTALPALPSKAVGAAGDLGGSLYLVINAGKGGRVLQYLPPVAKPAPAAAAPATDGKDAKAAAAPAATAATQPEMTTPAWSDSVLDIPFNVELMCGDNRSGFVFYGEGQLQSVQDFSKKPTPLPAPPFKLKALSGNAKEGLVAIAGEGDFIVYCPDPSKPAWNVALGPLAVEAEPS